jgi:hypothetical protein
MASLVAPAASGGLVPCPSALVLLLTAVSLGRTGLLVLYAKHRLPDGQKTASHAVFRYLPVVSKVLS